VQGIEATCVSFALLRLLGGFEALPISEQFPGCQS
jgi:hypothetical protein